MIVNPLYTQLDLGGTWHMTLFFGLAIAVVKWIYPSFEYPRSAKLLWIYVLISALFILEFPALHFGEFNTAFVASAGQTFAETVFIPLSAIMFFGYIKRLIPYFAGFSVLCVWMNWPGLLHAPSLNAAFAALAIPFVPWYLGHAIILTILTHHGSTALMIFAAQLGVTLIARKKFNYKISYLLFPAIAVAAYLHSGPMFDGGERLQKYVEYMTFWAKEWRWIVFGVGPGSFTWTAAMLDGFKAPIFIQMHSDWLQILWELGTVGLGLAVWAWISAVRKAWKETQILAGLFGCAAFALTYHPLRFYPTALLTAWIFVKAYSIVE